MSNQLQERTYCRSQAPTQSIYLEVHTLQLREPNRLIGDL